MNSQKPGDRLAQRAAAVLLVAFALLSSSIAVSAPPRGGGDVFSASRAAPAQTDAAACRDPQIARIEQETGTQARVFDYRASGTASGQLGGALEARGLVEHTGVCRGKPNALVMFIDNAKVAMVDDVTNDYFASSAGGRPPAGSNSGGTYGERPGYDSGRSTGRGDSDPELAAMRRQDDAALVGRCGTVYQQKGNFGGFPSCLSDRATGYCNDNRREPACIGIIAQAQDCNTQYGQGQPLGSSACAGYNTPGGSGTVLQGGVATNRNVGRPAVPSDGRYDSQYDKPLPPPLQGRLSANPQPPVRLNGNTSANTRRVPPNNLITVSTSVPTRDERSGKIYSANIDIVVDNNLPINLPVNVNLKRDGISKWKAARGQLVRQKTTSSRGAFLLESISDNGIDFQPVNKTISF